MNLHVSVATIIPIVVRICSFGVTITTLELLTRGRYMQDTGLMSWRISRLDHAWQVRGPVAPVLDRMLDARVFRGILIARLAVAATMTVAPEAVILNPALVWVAAVCAMAVPMRSRYGLDAADQVAIMVYVGLGLVLLAPTPLTKGAYVWFLGVQCVLAYVIAGVAKLVAAGWRDGTFLPNILCVRNYTPEGVGLFARGHPALLRVASRGIVGWECGFILVLILPLPLSLPFLAAGLSFHIVTAFVMGLKDFVWAFASLYPALLCCLAMRGW